MPKHLLKTPWVIWCGPNRRCETECRLPVRTSHPTETTCLRCLQLAVLGLERSLADARYVEQQVADATGGAS